MARLGYLVTLIFLLFSGQIGAAGLSIDTDWLEKHLNDPDLALIDMSSDQTQYQRFHIPGATYLPYQALVQQRRDGVTLRVSDQRLFGILGLIGIDAEIQVVIYDDMGGLNAGRLLWELERVGHKRVAILDGGLVKWILEGRKVTNKPVQPGRRVYRPSGGGRDNEADLAAVAEALAGGDTILLDVRTEQEYTGDPKIKRSGHIPGAHWWPWEGAVDFKGGFISQPADKLKQTLKALGIEKDTPVIAYCRTGHRASQSYYTLRSLGYENVRLYDGSISEWSIKPQQPLKLGSEP